MLIILNFVERILIISLEIRSGRLWSREVIRSTLMIEEKGIWKVSEGY